MKYLEKRLSGNWTAKKQYTNKDGKTLFKVLLTDPDDKPVMNLKVWGKENVFQVANASKLFDYDSEEVSNLKQQIQDLQDEIMLQQQTFEEILEVKDNGLMAAHELSWLANLNKDKLSPEDQEHLRYADNTLTGLIGQKLNFDEFYAKQIRLDERDKIVAKDADNTKNKNLNVEHER